MHRDTPQHIITLDGKIITGYQVASGQGNRCPYPQGSIRPQLPIFKERGLDLCHCYPGTLNIDISPWSFQLIKPDHTFRNVNWYQDIIEDFSFAACGIYIDNSRHDVWIYYPHPDTKPDHQQASTTIEILAPYLPAARYGQQVQLEIAESVILANKLT
ncbi:hypothetical protein [Aestuariibacter salexigens]|uniref:hypothetical protein n=1 Tax=Aestuariibacter salexigens TaxID=226010 RepID=UPI0004794117|nr:hypothetical protein [Aestuariibacter salexigens]